MLRPVIRFALTVAAIGAVLVALLVWSGRLGLETRLTWTPGGGDGRTAAAGDDPAAAPGRATAPETLAAVTQIPVEVAPRDAADAPAGVRAPDAGALGETAPPDAGEQPARAVAALTPARDGVQEDASEAGSEAHSGGTANGRPADAASAGARAEAEADPETAPVFDIVRVTPDGSAVIAGRGRPGERVDLIRDGEPVAGAVVDAQGNFAIIAEIGRVEGPISLQLRADRLPEGGAPDRLAAVEVLRPGSTGRFATALPAGDVVEDDAGAGAPDAAAPTPADGVYSDPVLLLPAETPGTAPQVVETGPEALAVAERDIAPVAGLVLDTVSYADGGAAVARGRSPAGAMVRVFVNNAAVAEAEAADDGTWQATLPRAAAERAALLRFEEVAPDGAVRRRLETRFDYAPGDGPLTVEERTIVVERGDSLWRIAENLYGEGLRYSVIFGANDALIVDPDLIYPEQVFVVPDLVPDTGPAERSPPPADRPVGQRP